MKYYVFGFEADSGEFFTLGEFGYNGRTLTVIAPNRETALDVFMDYIDADVLTEWLTAGAYVRSNNHIDNNTLIINEEE